MGGAYGGFIPIIIYSVSGSGNPVSDTPLLTENGLDILTENDLEILVET